MSRAGEKLYGDWQRWKDTYDLARPQRRRELLRNLILLVAVLVVGGSALFGGRENAPRIGSAMIRT